MGNWPILVILLFASIFTTSQAWEVSQNSRGQCAELYFQPSFKGPAFPLNDEEQISDLTDIQYYLSKEYEKFKGLQSEHNKDQSDELETQQQEIEPQQPSFSFHVKPQCKLLLSSQTFLKGEIHEYLEDVDNIDWLSPKSVACECPKASCSCEGIKLRRRECARAYIKDDCTNCKALFTSMHPGSWKTFPNKWSHNVKTIVLKHGCDLSLDFSSQGYTKRSKNIRTLSSATAQVVKDIQSFGNITRYECQCSSEDIDSDMDNEVDRTNNTYPPLVNIPKTKGGINTLFFKNELKGHPGLMAALQSLRNKRNSKNAYILLLGLTGSGKSSAVNLLFDHPNITKVGDYVSTTTDILEFSIPVKVNQLGMNNTALHVIDTPGIGDTRGIAEDSKFLASLDDFLSKHEDLKRNLPNVVLVFSKFSDNRYRGEGSGFVKMLRTIDLFKDRIVDKKSTNVIFVLTHYMSETKEIIRDPRDRVESIRKVIEEFTTLPRPIHIVLAENKPEESHLPSVNGFYRLPNGEFYPKNLFDQMHRDLVSNGDPVGEAIIRTAFSNSDHFKISGKRHRLLHPSNAKVTKYLGILGSFNTPVARTEVSIELNKAYSGLANHVKARYPEELQTLSRNFYLRNLHQISDLPQTTNGIVKLLEQVQLNPCTLFLLHTAFNMTIPTFNGNYIVGSGYSLVSDGVLPASIFKINGNSSQPSDLLMKFPELFSISLQNQLENHFQVFTNREAYIKGRMNALGLIDNALPKDTYNAAPQEYPGFNLISMQDDVDTSSEFYWNSLTATINYYTFQIKLNKKSEFSDEFLSSLNSLERLNTTDWHNVVNWRTFFENYGTHVVTHAYGGGNIKITTEVSDEGVSALSNTGKFTLLSESMGNILQQLANELIGKDASFLPPLGVRYEFSQRGGSRENFWSNFSELDDVKNIDLWRESLKYEPIVLTSRLQLAPISEIVKDHGDNRELGYFIEEAAATLLNASLVFIPMQKVGRDLDNPESRDMTYSEFGSTGDFESMQEFANMFKMMSHSTNDMQVALVQMLTESKEKQQVQEQRWQEDMNRMKQQQVEQERINREEERYNQELQLKREEMEMQRMAQENAMRLQMEQNRMQMNIQQATMMEDMRSKNEQMLISFINAENERQTQIMLNKKGWLDKTMDFLGGTMQNIMQSAALAAPAIAAAG